MPLSLKRPHKPCTRDKEEYITLALAPSKRRGLGPAHSWVSLSGSTPSGTVSTLLGARIETNRHHGEI